MPRPSLGTGTSTHLPARFGQEDELLVRVAALVEAVPVSELIRRSTVMHAHQVVLGSPRALELLQAARERLEETEANVAQVLGALVADQPLNTSAAGACRLPQGAYPAPIKESS